jgi:hypothetical protein
VKICPYTKGFFLKKLFLTFVGLIIVLRFCLWLKSLNVMFIVLSMFYILADNHYSKISSRSIFFWILKCSRRWLRCGFFLRRADKLLLSSW